MCARVARRPGRDRSRSFPVAPDPDAEPGCHNDVVETTRVDKWLWAVRVYPTRTAATDGCNGGHVRVNGSAAKPSTSVKMGDRVTATGTGARNGQSHERTLEVVKVIDKRVSASVAAECFIDHSPPPPSREQSSPMFQRDRATGRPTKKDRRQLDRFRSS